ncbi:hypothetical protein DYB25_004597 [Aphanomyces astaci]|uniref:HSF-type DNA-binding domain-containing protein n=1 Tax=Aphanomyces astaci TaxID=112090 RepID=A0A397EZD1_APHAT|nr:hypothetical protein DYB25_004597 [Aphanomyces astaci]RHY59018.1 hypothetical protein DYB34_002763 [Aphanomyces astaci]RHY60157.1 hypothetical protein DYB30_002997 [Aphanomyces astaci]RHY76420.1 hypothetical protein DYB38_004767 [Aphanomyces astaci]RHY84970.1 hypothetical protein DYB26_004402 [Aphanomyces astaci]
MPADEFNRQPRRRTTKMATAAAPPKFLCHLYAILAVEDPNVVAWSDDGSCFHLYDVNRLEREVLPKYFKHNKLSSFQRQLNYFGFRKWTKTQSCVCTFSHPRFHRDSTPAAWGAVRNPPVPRPQGPLQHHPPPQQQLVDAGASVHWKQDIATIELKGLEQDDDAFRLLAGDLDSVYMYDWEMCINLLLDDSVFVEWAEPNQDTVLAASV